ncbi:MAG: 3-isopropylmalate dehydratase small subunit [Proteobacteria bacterium]|nr:3-isopropylmalate dehydratase small subunit [Desulfobacula sp.]MBU3954618.1 3-isopropylmalate dehydratase small subunit [Pseudomonadota bacterium]MBU4131083.1 3-isopropylmalate dehydratase small subunit [Pseudomonadota bacterium]
MKKFKGKILCLDRSDINTDEIIPAKYLTEIEKRAMGPHLLEDLTLEGFDVQKDLKDIAAIVTRENFGCGSSREHAPWALEVNGVFVVIAQSFARIFRQNMFNCGMLAIALPKEQIEHLFECCKIGDSFLSVDLETATIQVTSQDKHFTLPFTISEFDKTLVETGGWLEYADANY